MNASILKIIAIIAMVFDHIGYIFFPQQTWLRAIGRLTMPIMAFFAAEGYKYTRNIYKYMIRLFIFAVISEIPFCLAFNEQEKTFLHFHNVIFTIFLGVFALWLGNLLKKLTNKKILTIIIYIICCYLAILLETDWSWTGVAMIIVFYEANKNINNKNGLNQNKTSTINAKWTIIGLTCVYIGFFIYEYINDFINGTLNGYEKNFINIYGLLSLPLLCLYNQKKGPKLKYLFYIFYPTHLLLLYFIYEYLI